VIWVAGCSRRCPGCIGEPLRDPAAGEDVLVEDLTRRVLSWPDIEGLTFSGGEPFQQAAALAALCDAVRKERDLTLMCFSGFTLEELRASADPGVQGLLAVLDILVDGPFQRERQRSLLWRGSDNQRVHFLSDRYRHLAPGMDGPGAGVEVHVSRKGRVFWAGIPDPGFAEELQRLLCEQGIILTDTDGIWS
jgi:anaerobic ribonucleoside-triphosphate reductase activating protein